MLAVMLSVTKDFPAYQFVIGGAPSLENDFYQPYLKDPKVGFVSNKTYALLRNSHAALVTSGTATLETALLKVPQVVCYKGSWISYQIARQLITLKYISLVNLIMDREVVKELIQNELTTNNLKNELGKILSGEVRQAQLQAYEALEKKLGGKGASEKTAALIIAGLGADGKKVGEQA